MPKKIIIDTDPGIDDAMAILFAFNVPDVEVVGLTTICGMVQIRGATFPKQTSALMWTRRDY